MSLNQEQYDSIIKTYEKAREANRYLSEARKDEIYKEIPQMQLLDDEVRALALSRMHTLLKLEDADTGKKEENSFDREATFAQIASKRKALLIQAGYPSNYLDPIYDCDICKDTGYIRDEYGFEVKCQCFLAKQQSLLYEQSNIREIISTENFSTLSYDYYQGEDLELFKRAVKKSLEFTKNFSDTYQNIVFYGTVGTGKSFLSGCIAKELLDRGFSVVYFSATGLFELLARYSFDIKAKESLYNFYKDLYNIDCVIIDDLGTEVTNSFVTSQLFSCLNERNTRKKATIISTNLGLEELRDRYSDRVFSRITSNYTLCKLTGPDIRMRKHSLSHTTE